MLPFPVLVPIIKMAKPKSRWEELVDFFLGPHTDECVRWWGNRGSGYGQVTDLNGISRRVNRAVLAMKLGRPVADDLGALHNCQGGPLCCHPGHLYEGNRLDNAIDRRLVGGYHMENGGFAQGQKALIAALEKP